VPLLIFGVLFTQPLYAGPIADLVNKIRDESVPVARGASIIAIVLGGLAIAYLEGAAKRIAATLLIGCGIALMAPRLIDWLGL
jgi:TrbC/VIRB2 pilin